MARHNCARKPRAFVIFTSKMDQGAARLTSSMPSKQ